MCIRDRSRPHALDYINALCDDTFLELHGDRNFADDKAMVGGLGKLENQTFMFVGTQKGYNTKTRQYRNFGMAKPEGYRKALRLMKTAEKFGIPIISFIDTPGAYPGLGAEERGQGQAIANNIFQMTSIKTPIIVTIICPQYLSKPSEGWRCSATSRALWIVASAISSGDRVSSRR